MTLLNTILNNGRESALNNSKHAQTLWLNHMKFNTVYFIILFVFCSEVNAQSLASLDNILKSYGSSKLIENVLENSIKIEQKRLLSLTNELRQMGNEEIIQPTPLWKVQKLIDGKGVKLSLERGRYYFTTSPVKILKLKVCSNGGASSGSAFKINKNGTRLNFNWSCGSIGCSYWAKLGEGFESCKSIQAITKR